MSDDQQKTDDFRALLMEKIENLHDCVDNVEKSLAEVKFDLIQRIDKMDQMLSAHAEMLPGLKEGVDDWKDTKKWASRIIIGAVITALLGIVILKKQG